MLLWCSEFRQSTRASRTPTCFLVTWLVGLLLGWFLDPGTVAGFAKQLDVYTYIHMIHLDSQKITRLYTVIHIYIYICITVYNLVIFCESKCIIWMYVYTSSCFANPATVPGSRNQPSKRPTNQVTKKHVGVLEALVLCRNSEHHKSMKYRAECPPIFVLTF